MKPDDTQTNIKECFDRLKSGDVQINLKECIARVVRGLRRGRRLWPLAGSERSVGLGDGL